MEIFDLQHGKIFIRLFSVSDLCHFDEKLI